MSGPGVHHDPPHDFASLSLPLAPVPQSWVRVHPEGYGAIFFGRTGRYRFDAPENGYGVLYVGADVECAFIETFGHATGTRSVTQAELQARIFSRIKASRPLQLVDLTGSGLARLGADARLTSGESYLAPRRWAQAIHDHPAQPDGLLFRARHDPDRICAALFDRVAPLLSEERMGSLWERQHQRLLGRLLEQYNFGLL